MPSGEVSKLIDHVDWDKISGQLPVIIQNYITAEVLMFGVMSKEALQKTLDDNIVTFYSRTKQRLWTKGETSGDYLKAVDYALDCDLDTLLITVIPKGNTCHLGTKSCFSRISSDLPWVFFSHLEEMLDERKTADPETSYTASLYAVGKKRIAQKVGEEGVEVALAAMSEDKEEILNEAADLIYHTTVLLHDQNLSWTEVLEVLKKRHQG